jgi:hypothetical protein
MSSVAYLKRVWDETPLPDVEFSEPALVTPFKVNGLTGVLIQSHLGFTVNWDDGGPHYELADEVQECWEKLNERMQ